MIASTGTGPRRASPHRPGVGRGPARRRGLLGQATVEFALVLPLVIIVLLAGVDVVVISRDAAHVQHVARIAARVAAVEGDVSRATAAAHSQLPEAEISVALAPVGEAVSATVRLRVAEHLAVLGVLRPNLDVSATVAMRREGDPDE